MWVQGGCERNVGDRGVMWGMGMLTKNRRYCSMY